MLLWPYNLIRITETDMDESVDKPSGSTIMQDLKVFQKMWNWS